MDKTHYCAQFRTKKKWHAAAHAFTPPPLLWKMVGFLMVSVWNKTDIWAFISHKRTGKIRLENNNKCRNLERLKWRPFFFIPHSFGVPAAAASTKTTACTKLTFVSYTTSLSLSHLDVFAVLVTGLVIVLVTYWIARNYCKISKQNDMFSMASCMGYH